MKSTHWKEQTSVLKRIALQKDNKMDNFEATMARHYASIYHLALSILDDPDEAEDAAQETFISASTKLEDFRGESDIKTWLFSITINCSRGKLRKRKTQRALKNVLQSFQRLASHTRNPEKVALQTEMDEQLWRVVDSFHDKHRIPIILRYVHQLPVSDIARILDVKEGTIHSRLFYAHQKIRRELMRTGFSQLEDQEASR
jgi:RNA polymerase sigma-70 factor (ECF subfamily)